MFADTIKTKIEENDMPTIPGRQEPVTPQEIMQAIATQEGGGNLVNDYLASTYRAQGVRGTKAELRQKAHSHLEMMRHMGTVEDYHDLVRRVVDFHNGRLWDAQRGDIRAKFSHMF